MQNCHLTFPDSLTVRYSGYLNHGDQFQTVVVTTFAVGAWNTIAGLSWGVEGMRVGGRRRLRIGPIQRTGRHVCQGLFRRMRSSCMRLSCWRWDERGSRCWLRWRPFFGIAADETDKGDSIEVHKFLLFCPLVSGTGKRVGAAPQARSCFSGRTGTRAPEPEEVVRNAYLGNWEARNTQQKNARRRDHIRESDSALRSHRANRIIDVTDCSVRPKISDFRCRCLFGYTQQEKSSDSAPHTHVIE